jgi:hypothetical protein
VTDAFEVPVTAAVNGAVLPVATVALVDLRVIATAEVEGVFRLTQSTNVSDNRTIKDSEHRETADSRALVLSVPTLFSMKRS